MVRPSAATISSSAVVIIRMMKCSSWNQSATASTPATAAMSKVRSLPPMLALIRSTSREARAQHDRGGGERQQRAQRPLAFGAEKQDAVERGEPPPRRAREAESGRSAMSPCRHTRSLDFSAIRPVGRHAMMAMMTASANTSL